jgi:hypothetical protein
LIAEQSIKTKCRSVGGIILTISCIDVKYNFIDQKLAL